eukprot:775150-Alexandrium_andersonii.AAC.1
MLVTAFSDTRVSPAPQSRACWPRLFTCKALVKACWRSGRSGRSGHSGQSGQSGQSGLSGWSERSGQSGHSK